MPDVTNEQLLALWLDGRLNAQQRLMFEQRCVDDEVFAQQVEAANNITVHAQHFIEQDVPHWDRAASFTEVKNTPWWHWQGLSGLSIAMSVAAMLMVVTGLQIKVDDGALTISFADNQSQLQIERLVEDKLQEYKTEQQLAMNRFTQSLQQQQLDASSQLTQYLLTSSRKERREDFAELIKFVNEQRSDDQLFYARQLNQLQQDIYTNPAQSGLNSNKE
ncbi:MAG: hypothetical protein NWQ54_21430 [Paraglaciecola sp.]|uniref:hypothetical protein n=1 Tax=Pseudomonadati TaxID=3379134 RepID=UPI00273F3052|nr:hypothetical protein [Paraglaciecola sp.]MDP5029337.1 hypothetical protein [Paraglaciecola sp.]MDP5041749.1 hypothetical protein [Paraglaciecola sp.]MDP5133452.1 hypothetical protein [Paraglaciecola sp.]